MAIFEQLTRGVLHRGELREGCLLSVDIQLAGWRKSASFLGGQGQRPIERWHPRGRSEAKWPTTALLAQTYHRVKNIRAGTEDPRGPLGRLSLTELALCCTPALCSVEMAGRLRVCGRFRVKRPFL